MTTAPVGSFIWAIDQWVNRKKVSRPVGLRGQSIATRKIMDILSGCIEKQMIIDDINAMDWMIDNFDED